MGLDWGWFRRGQAPGLAGSWSHVSRQLMCPGLREPLVTFECHFFWFQVETQLDRAMLTPTVQPASWGGDPGALPMARKAWGG